MSSSVQEPSSKVISRRFTARPALEILSDQLRVYRENYKQELQRISELTCLNLNPPLRHERSGDLNGIFKVYIALRLALTRCPTIYEITDKYNSVHSSDYSVRTMRHYMRLINEKLPEGYPKLRTSARIESKIYKKNIVECYAEFADLGRMPSLPEFMKRLKELNPGAKVTQYIVRKLFDGLKADGIHLKLSLSDLEQNVLKTAFQDIQARIGCAPSLGNLRRYLEKEYGIKTKNVNISKMLRCIRNSLPKEQRAEWMPTRPKHGIEGEFLIGHRGATRELAGKDIYRPPSIEEIRAYLAKKNPDNIPSLRTIREGLAEINLTRIRREEPPLCHTRAPSVHQDLTEACFHTLKRKLNRAPSILEVAKALDAAGNSYPRVAVSQMIWKLAHRKDSSIAIKTIPHSKDIYDSVIESEALSFLERNQRASSFTELHAALLDDHSERCLSLSQLKTRVCEMKRRGVRIEVLRAAVAHTPPVREDIRHIDIPQDQIRYLKQVVEQEIEQRFGKRVPVQVEKLKAFFHQAGMAVYAESADMSSARKEVRDLLKFNSRIYLSKRRIKQS